MLHFDPRGLQSVPLRVLIMFLLHPDRLGVQVAARLRADLRERQRLALQTLLGIWSYIYKSMSMLGHARHVVWQTTIKCNDMDCRGRPCTPPWLKWRHKAVGNWKKSSLSVSFCRMQQGCFTPLRRVNCHPSHVLSQYHKLLFRGTIKHLVHYFAFPTRRPPVLIQTISQRSYLQKADYPRDRLAEPWICYLKVINTAVVFWSYLSLVSTGAAAKLHRIKIHLPWVVKVSIRNGLGFQIEWSLESVLKRSASN